MEKEGFTIHKEFLIKSRKDNILNHYDFSPKVQKTRIRNSEKEPMASYIRPKKKLEENGEPSKKLPKKTSKTPHSFSTKSMFSKK